MQTIKITKQYPVVITPKFLECRDFYIRFFGFALVFDSDWYIQLEHESGVELAFMRPHLSNQPAFLHPEYDGKGIIITFDVQDAQKEYEKAKGMEGLRIARPYVEEAWGQKHFLLEDPAGMFVDVVQQIS